MDFIPYVVSAFEGAQIPAYSLLARSFVSDESIKALAQEMCLACQYGDSSSGDQLFYGNFGIAVGAGTGVTDRVSIYEFYIRSYINDMLYVALVQCPDCRQFCAEDGSVTNLAGREHKIRVLYNVGIFKNVGRLIKRLAEAEVLVLGEGFLNIEVNIQVRQFIGELLVLIFRRLFQRIGGTLSPSSSTQGDYLSGIDKADQVNESCTSDPEDIAPHAASLVVDFVVALFGYNAPDIDASVTMVHAKEFISILSGCDEAGPRIEALCRGLVSLVAGSKKTAHAIWTARVESGYGDPTGERRRARSATRALKASIAQCGDSKGLFRFAKQYGDGVLREVSTDTEDPASLGTVYVVVDCSGSTHQIQGGVSIASVFEVACMAMASSAQASGQDIVFIFYGDTVHYTARLSATDSAVQWDAGRIGLAGHAGNYENVEGVAFDRAFSIMDMDRMARPDVPQTLLFLTDGMILTSRSMRPTELNQMLRRRQKSHGLKVIGLIFHRTLDSKFKMAFEGFKHLHIESLKDFQATTLNELMEMIADVPPLTLPS